MTVVFSISLLFFLLSIITRPFTVLFHELGHGLAGLLLTNDKVTIYIGSYGDPSKSFVIEMGRLKIFFKRNFFIWGSGLYESHCKTSTINKEIIISLMGPLFTLVLGSLCFYLALFYNIHGALKIISLAFLISCLIDFYYNIIPNHEPIWLYNGNKIYNDGMYILQLLKYRKVDFQKVELWYANKEYKKVVDHLNPFIVKGVFNENICRYALIAFFFNNDFENANRINDIIVENDFKKSSNDFIISGIIKSNLNNNEGALNDYQNSIDLNPNNPDVFNNRGYSYNVMGEYEKAILDFNKAMEIEKDFSYALCNRGYSNIKLGNLEEGYQDIIKSIELDKENSYGFKNLGVYFLIKREYKTALTYLEKAKRIKTDTHDIDRYIKEVKKHL